MTVKYGAMIATLMFGLASFPVTAAERLSETQLDQITGSGQEVGGGRSAVNDTASGKSNASAKNNNGQDKSGYQTKNGQTYDTRTFKGNNGAGNKMGPCGTCAGSPYSQGGGGSD